MNSSLGYASHQQQYTTHPANETVSVLLFFSILLVLFAAFMIYFWYTELHTIPAQQRGEQAVSQQQEVYVLIDNLAMQVKMTFRMPLITLMTVLYKKLRHKDTSGPEQRVYAAGAYHLLSLLFFSTAILSLTTLVAALKTATSKTIQTTLFLLVLSINLYLITRQRCYYHQKQQLFGPNDAHHHAVYETRFADWDRSMASNWVQILILVIEFFQLLSFPLRDLLSLSQHGPTSHTLSFLLNVGGWMPDIKTPSWYVYSVWTTFAVVVCSLTLAIVIHSINARYPYKLSTRWVRWCLPVVTLLYIPILTTFVGSAACQSLNEPSNAFSLTLRCHSPTVPRQPYLWLSLIGYVLAYFLTTLFLSSHERVPNKNEIAYKSISVAFIKNMGLLLAIVFLLVESTTKVNRMRALLSTAILFTMICYNIKTSPCYVDKINFFRTGSFVAILWTSALVAVLSDSNAIENLGPGTVISIVLTGWVFILFMFILLYFIYYARPSAVP
ncbi:hypothetical protein G6F43_012158 [Rhizopus delemar]|nr:hypothetical protein G6F43_012158 [Rhizopus delemar]